MFLMGFPKAALEKQFYLFYDPEALRGSGASTSQGLCTDSAKRRAGSQGTPLAKSAWQKPVPALRWVRFYRRLRTQRPQSRHSAHSITLTCALPVIPCSTGQQETWAYAFYFRLLLKKLFRPLFPAVCEASQSLVILITGSLRPF